MNFQKTFKDLAQNGEIRGNQNPRWPVVLLTLAFVALVIGSLIYGLYNASQIERAGRNECVISRDATC